MPSADAALAELGLVTTPAGSTKRILHPMDRAMRPLTPGQVAIPKFETLREMAERYSVQHLTPPSDEKRSTQPFKLLLHEHGRHCRQSELMFTLHISAIYCQTVAMRIFSRRRP